jgi:hypothetical protein
MPGEGQTPLDSDVVAWRSAWKLWQAVNSGAGAFFNITVVDDRGEPYRCYATGRVEFYNPRPEAEGAPPIGAEPAHREGGDEVFADAQPGSEEADAEGGGRQ